MFQDAITTRESHERFVERVATSKLVWGLKSDEGWAVSPSNDYEGVDVMPFWSDRAYAKRAATDEWKNYVPTSIPLDLFVDRWLKGMNEDGTLVGTNWDAHNFGREVEPVELARELLDEVDNRGATL